MAVLNMPLSVVIVVILQILQTSSTQTTGRRFHRWGASFPRPAAWPAFNQRPAHRDMKKKFQRRKTVFSGRWPQTSTADTAMFYPMDKPWIATTSGKKPPADTYVDVKFIFEGITDNDGNPIEQEVRAYHTSTGQFLVGMRPLTENGAKVVAWRAYDSV